MIHKQEPIGEWVMRDFIWTLCKQWAEVPDVEKGADMKVVTLMDGHLEHEMN